MDKTELAKKLAAHKEWLSDNERGERLCLRTAGLSGADLSGADLRWADLSGAKGFMLLPVQDMRGYSFAHAILCDDGWRIRAGCRDFTIDEALAHWGDSYWGNRGQGDMYLYAVEWLRAKLENER